jgi:hypothetical protein
MCRVLARTLESALSLLYFISIGFGKKYPFFWMKMGSIIIFLYRLPFRKKTVFLDKNKEVIPENGRTGKLIDPY